MIYVYIFLGIILYLTYCVGAICLCLQYKATKGPWWANVLVIPMLPMAYVVGFFTKMARDKYK